MSFLKLIHIATMVIVATLPDPTQQGTKAADRPIDRPQAKIADAGRGTTRREKVRPVATVRYNVR